MGNFDWSTLILPTVTALITSGTLSSVLLYFIKRRDRLEDLEKSVARQGEGIAVLTEGFVVLLEALHRQGIVNGESEHVRKSMNDYLLKNTKNGLS